METVGFGIDRHAISFNTRKQPASQRRSRSSIRSRSSALVFVVRFSINFSIASIGGSAAIGFLPTSARAPIHRDDTVNLAARGRLQNVYRRIKPLLPALIEMQLHVPGALNSSKINSSMRLPVSTIAVARIVRLPPSSTLRAEPKNFFGLMSARPDAARQSGLCPQIVITAGKTRDAVE